MYIGQSVASAEQLERLPLIGEKVAMRIVEYRHVNSPLSDGPTNAAGQKCWVRYAVKSRAILTG